MESDFIALFEPAGSFSMQPAQILAVKQEVLRADARKLGEWAQQLLDADDPAASLQAP